MLKTKCIQPEILGILASSGHGDRILIADGNFPASTKAEGIPCVRLGYAPGCPSAPEILRVLLETVRCESAALMAADDGTVPEAEKELASVLEILPPLFLPRAEFYAACGEPRVKLVILTGENRPYGNVLLTLGV